MLSTLLRLLPTLVFAASASSQPPNSEQWREPPLGPMTDAESQFRLAETFHYGQGTSRNLSAAFEWYALAADQGHPDAMNLVGMFYMGGLSVAEDCRAALYWFDRAAQADNVHALNNASWVLSTCPDPRYRDGKRALELVISAIEMDGLYAAFQGTMAAAYAELGEFDRAVRLLEAATEAMLDEGKYEAAAESTLMLEQFRNRKPWRGALFIDPEDFRD